TSGLRFDQAVSAVPLTLPSHATILSGLLPPHHGLRDNGAGRFPADRETMASRFSASGYRTGAFVGSFVLDHRFGLNRGFEIYDDEVNRDPASPAALEAERPGSVVVDRALEWLARENGKPFFAWVHLYDAHAPYAPPSPFAERYAKNPYLGEIAALDAALLPLLDAIRARERSLAVVTADHGESLGEHGEETHGLFAYEATLHVPLVLRGSGVTPGTDSRPARHVDVAPTLLAAAGPAGAAPFDGAPLLAAESPSRSYFEALSATFNRGWAPLRGVLDTGKKYIDLPLPELYELSTDPREAKNLLPDDEKLRAFRRLIPPEAYDEKRPGAPRAEDAAKLRSLGYLPGSAPAKAAYGPGDDPKRLVPLDAALQRAVSLYQRGRLQDAIAALKGVVKARPTMAAGYEQLAFLYQQKGDLGAAERTLRDSFSRKIATEAMAQRLALVLCEAGRPKEAVAVLEPYAASKDPDTLDALGIAWSDSGDLGRAVEAFSRALALDAGDARARQNLGIAYLKADDPQRARAELEAALAINDRLAGAWNGLGVARARLNDVDGALAAWRKSYESDPTRLDGLLNLGLLAARTGRAEAAKAALGEFLEHAPPGMPERRQAEEALRASETAR
ncbi:MAG TPA: sulfatase-like hydrolase/transferase, partial [Thermoanaerobaculia bacterium]|nr:sulfatase-like hydrolase/transferase [Thermoanaerobaculia bacterium]